MRRTILRWRGPLFGSCGRPSGWCCVCGAKETVEYLPLDYFCTPPGWIYLKKGRDGLTWNSHFDTTSDYRYRRVTAFQCVILENINRNATATNCKIRLLNLEFLIINITMNKNLSGLFYWPLETGNFFQKQEFCHTEISNSIKSPQRYNDHVL